jgi:hypothetical protein
MWVAIAIEKKLQVRQGCTVTFTDNLGKSMSFQYDVDSKEKWKDLTEGDS